MFYQKTFLKYLKNKSCYKHKKKTNNHKVLILTNYFLKNNISEKFYQNLQNQNVHTYFFH